LADTTADAPGRNDNQSADHACDNIRMVMKHLHAVHTRMDKHAKTQSELLRRDALRDHPVTIHAASTTALVPAPYRNTREFLSTPQREQTPRMQATTVVSPSTLNLSRKRLITRQSSTVTLSHDLFAWTRRKPVS
jgi:hypothetical protein